MWHSGSPRRVWICRTGGVAPSPTDRRAQRRWHPRCGILAADFGLDLPQPGHGRDGLRRQLRALVDVQLVEAPPNVGKAGCKPHTIISARWLGEPVVGGIAIDLQDAGKPRQMALDACTAAAVLEPVGEDDVKRLFELMRGKG
jgi:hypothetical protein